MAIAFKRKTVLPAIVVNTETFRAGFIQAEMGGPVIGWPVQFAPTERTLVEFLNDASDLIVESNHKEDTVRLLAGFLAGRLRREQ